MSYGLATPSSCGSRNYLMIRSIKLLPLASGYPVYKQKSDISLSSMANLLCVTRWNFMLTAFFSIIITTLNLFKFHLMINRY